MSEFNRFEMEEQIMNCWRVTDDLRDLSEGVLGHKLTPDQTANILIGLEKMYTLRFEKLFNQFSAMLESQRERISY